MGKGLGPEHISNLKVLPSRAALLEVLPKCGIVAEVGVAEGDFSQSILQICCPSELHLIDYWGSTIPKYGTTGHHLVSEKFETEISDGKVVMHRGWSWEELNKLPDETFDWIYIDANHSYESVRKDLLAARPKLKPQGIISGHDYVKWSSQTGRFGVVEAVNEFCITFNYEMIYLTLQRDMHLSYAIRQMD